MKEPYLRVQITEYIHSCFLHHRKQFSIVLKNKEKYYIMNHNGNNVKNVKILKVLTFLPMRL